MKKITIGALLCLLFPFMSYAQTTIKGKVLEASTNEPVIGANVFLVGTTKGDAADVEGNYQIVNVPSGTYTVRVSSIGYTTITKVIKVSGTVLELNFELEMSSQALDAMEVFASRAKERETPVAFTNFDEKEIQRTLGSRDIPLILNTAPAVYATVGGGGAGDSRVNVRGFDQKNIAVMINGIPMNDMENGWVYWSNWDGVGDVTESLQLQRGLSAVNLATPSIGGTFNIITNPAKNSAGGAYKQEFGNDGFKKSTLILNSGMINDKFAFSAVGVRKTGDGFVEGTWTDAYAWYLGATFLANDKNTFTLTALGAPQRHGQNSYKQNIAAYDGGFAKDIDGYLDGAFDKYNKPEYGGRDWNENVSYVSYMYEGKQFWNGKSHNRYDPNFINERENYYNKPVVSLNWFSQLSESALLSTVAYYSGGKGGGSGTLGDISWDYSGPSRRVDYDATIAVNRGTLDRKGNAKDAGVSNAILRNSVNNQWTVGAISKLAYDVSDNFKLTGGIDWRTAELEHFREVRDLLGGNYYVDNGNQYNLGKHAVLGDKIDYNFTNNVNWFGFFLDGEYSTEKFSSYAMAGLSTIKYKHENFFKKDVNGNKIDVESDNIWGSQLKGGALYKASEYFDVFANVGYASKVPIFDNVIDDGTGVVNDDPKNEKFIAIEGGTHVYAMQDQLSFTINGYLTNWSDRSFTKGVINLDGSEGLVSITGVEQQHMGVELEVAFQPVSQVRFDGALSLGKWEYLDNVEFDYRETQGSNIVTKQDTLYIKDLKVGDAPQSQMSYSLTLFPVEDLFIQATGKTFWAHYSGFDPLTRDDKADESAGTWRAPGYTVFDLHIRYTFVNVFDNVDVELFGSIFNLLDETYIEDSIDNSAYNSYDQDHDADDAEVYLGLPRSYNMGFKVNF